MASSEVRRATEADRLTVIALVREFYRDTRPGGCFDAARVEAMFKACLARGLVLMLGDDGVLMAIVTEDPFDGMRTAREAVWFIRPAARGRSAMRMLDAYEEWARSQGCEAVSMACLNENDLTRLYARRGYTPAETHFLKPLR